jgi:hypothetical protein
VVTVTALSDGLDDAQQKVLRPLTGVGTDMSVNRPVKARGGSFGPVGGSRLPSAEQDQLRKCASGRRRQAVLSQSYADRQKLSVGDTFALKAHTYHVVGLAEAPLGGQASDVAGVKSFFAAPTSGVARKDLTPSAAAGSVGTRGPDHRPAGPRRQLRRRGQVCARPPKRY